MQGMAYHSLPTLQCSAIQFSINVAFCRLQLPHINGLPIVYTGIWVVYEGQKDPMWPTCWTTILICSEHVGNTYVCRKAVSRAATSPTDSMHDYQPCIWLLWYYMWKVNDVWAVWPLCSTNRWMICGPHKHIGRLWET